MSLRGRSVWAIVLLYAVDFSALESLESKSIYVVSYFFGVRKKCLEDT